MPKAKVRTNIWVHTNPGLLMALCNQVGRGKAMWVPSIEIGPFTSEFAAIGFLNIWVEKSSKERESRVLWAFILYDAYCSEYSLELIHCTPDKLAIDDERAKWIKSERATAHYLKRSRRGDPLSTRQRLWELLPDDTRRVTCGGVKGRREIREKLRKAKKKRENALKRKRRRP